MASDQDAVIDTFVPLGSSTNESLDSAGNNNLTTAQLQRAVADVYSSRDLIMSDCSSCDDDEDDGNSYADEAQLTPEKNTITSFPKRLLSMADNPDDASLVEAEAIAGIEDRVIARNLRLFVFAIFLTLCIVLPIVVHRKSSNNQVETFETTFYSYSDKIFDSVQTKLDRQLTAANSLAIALTSHATNTVGVTWPFVTLPDFHLRADNARDLGKFLSVSLAPVVTEQQRFFWQVFTQENLDWLWQAQGSSNNATSKFTSTATEELKQEIGSLPGADKMIESTWGNQLDFDDSMWSIHNGQAISKDIYRPHPSGLGFAPEAPEHSPFLPLWLQMPAISTMINLNVLSLLNISTASNATMNSAAPTISEVVDLKDVSQAQRAVLTEYYTMLLQDYHGDPNAQYEGDPIVTMFFPVFDSFDDTDKTFVAELAANIQFQQYFANVLPGESGGVLAVVANTCGDVFSYEVTGESAEFLGHDDFHDPSFDHLKQSCDFASMAMDEFHSGPKSHPDLDSDFCRYTVTLYPSASLHEQYVTNDPVMYAVIIAVVIIFVSLVSLAYDLIVQRRMTRLIDAARNNKALLTSLYPDNVRERLLKEEQERKQRALPRRNSNSSMSGGIGNSSRRNSAEHSKQVGNEPPVRRGSNDKRCQSSPAGRRRHSGDHLISEIFHSSVSGVATAVSGVSSGVSTVVTGVGNMAGFLVTPLAPSKIRLKFLLKEQDHQKSTADTASTEKSDGSNPNEKPIADLFPHCTVLFADIAGFTAWSSEREPEQVFALLQEVFGAFDRLAKRRDVFKVETIGDCYVAVTGLPDAQPDHAVRMVRFARACMQAFLQEINRLEVMLGPGTGTLRMRCGIHSGPVTAGVLRGEKSRFQLFGDTVNTASRVESTGQRNRIQVSQQTANLLLEAGKDNWILPRKDLVEAKGKGTMQTYWVLTRRAPNESTPLPRPKFVPLPMTDEEDDSDNDSQEGSDWGHDDADELETESPNLWTLSQQQVREHYERLIDWQVELFSKILREIVAGRDTASLKSNHALDPQAAVKSDGPVYDEVLECIQLPKFDPRAMKARISRSDSVELPPEVVNELHTFIRTIASQYRQNPFHSYAHASHVVQSANKLLGRIVKPELDWTNRRQSLNTIASEMHRFTYGITSDPLTHFAVLFATLIHDVDHSGVSNAQRGAEEPEMATIYKNKSIAEQNSIDLAWNELSESKYANLRHCLFATNDDLTRFRQLTVNLVMATDIFEKNMKELRSKRWDKAFHRDATSCEHKITPFSLEDDKNMKATIVIEHIIQAADVSHCMQHWHVYKRWNERLFQEMFLAYEEGRGGKDPTEGWYNGELWFFDHYIIPLAKKLEECGVFGVSSDECLNYALENRKEWESKGKEIVAEMVQRYRLWRSRGENLGNPFEEDCLSGDIHGLPTQPLVDESAKRNDDEADDDETDDESVVEA